MDYGEAFELQRVLVEQRKRDEIADQFPHRGTSAHHHARRNGHMENLVAREDELARAGVAFLHTNRGGDITYHGPGQIVGYPILDLREWKRDVMAYVRALEQTIIDALADFGIGAGREPGMTGVWIDGARSRRSACT